MGRQNSSLVSSTRPPLSCRHLDPSPPLPLPTPTPQELYGAERTSTITAALSRLFTGFLQRSGFTCGMSDVFLVRPG